MFEPAVDFLEIAIDPPHQGVYPVRVTTALGEQATSTLTLPINDLFLDTILAKLTYRDGQTTFSDGDVTRLGQRLHDLLIHGNTAKLFQSALCQAQLTKRLLQLRLIIAAHKDLVAVAALPWEFAIDSTGMPLVIHHSMVRSIPYSTPIEPLLVQGPLSMLLVWAHPLELAVDYALDINAEVTAIQTHLRPLVETDRLTVNIVSHATLDELYYSIRQYQPHMVHLIGHGCSTANGHPGFVLEMEGGGMQILSPRQLSIALLDTPVRLVILNACSTGVQGSTLFSAFGPALLAANIPAVIGMQAPVHDFAGCQFATALYHSIVRDGSIDKAVQAGRRAVMFYESANIDWGLAAVYMRDRHGQLFRGVAHENKDGQASLNLPGLVELTLAGQVSEFTETRRATLIEVLSSLLDVPPETIKIRRVRDGSIKVLLELPESAIEKLRQLFETGILPSKLAIIGLACPPFETDLVSSLSSLIIPTPEADKKIKQSLITNFRLEFSEVMAIMIENWEYNPNHVSFINDAGGWCIW